MIKKAIKKPVKRITRTSKASVAKKAAEESLGLKKKYNKANTSCKVTFGLPGVAVVGVQTVTIVGDFNGWDEKATPLKKLKNGEFKIMLDLLPGNEYRFRYFIDACRWENDWSADSYVPNIYGCEDSVVIV